MLEIGAIDGQEIARRRIDRADNSHRLMPRSCLASLNFTGMHWLQNRSMCGPIAYNPIYRQNKHFTEQLSACHNPAFILIKRLLKYYFCAREKTGTTSYIHIFVSAVSGQNKNRNTE